MMHITHTAAVEERIRNENSDLPFRIVSFWKERERERERVKDVKIHSGGKMFLKR